MYLIFSTIMLRKMPFSSQVVSLDLIQLLPSSTTKKVQLTKIIPTNSAVCVCVCERERVIQLPKYSRLCGQSINYQQMKLTSKLLPIPRSALSGVSLLPTSL